MAEEYCPQIEGCHTWKIPLQITDRAQFHRKSFRVKDDRITVNWLIILLESALFVSGVAFDLISVVDGLDIMECALDARYLFVNLVSGIKGI